MEQPAVEFDEALLLKDPNSEMEDPVVKLEAKAIKLF